MATSDFGSFPSPVEYVDLGPVVDGDVSGFENISSDGADALNSLGVRARESMHAPPVSSVAGLEGVPSGVGGGEQFLHLEVTMMPAVPNFSAGAPAGPTARPGTTGVEVLSDRPSTREGVVARF